MKKLLASPLGSALKAFAVTILTMVLSLQTDLFSMDLVMVKTLVTAGVLSAIPPIINWLNPSYKGYGINKSE